MLAEVALHRVDTLQDSEAVLYASLHGQMSDCCSDGALAGTAVDHADMIDEVAAGSLGLALALDMAHQSSVLVHA
jgi:hypothetical protein